MTIEKFTDATFYNKPVEDINRDLESLGWIDNIYPIARMGIDQGGTFPEVYNNDGTKYSIRALPKDNSISFFMLNDPIQQIDETESYLVEMSLYVWGDLTKIDTARDYDYTAELIRDVQSVLKDNNCYNLLIETNDVFSEFEQMEKVLNQNVMLPYTAFKITFNLNVLTC